MNIDEEKIKTLVIAAGQHVDAPNLTQADHVWVYQNATLNAPALTQADWVWVHQNATLNAPLLAGPRQRRSRTNQ